MPDKIQNDNFEVALAQLENGWQEFGDYLRSRARAREKTLRVEKLGRLDDLGEPRGRQGVEADASAGLVLMDRAGHRAWLEVKGDGSGYLSRKDRLGRIGFEAPDGGRDAQASEEEARVSPAAGEYREVPVRLEKGGEDWAGLKGLLSAPRPLEPEWAPAETAAIPDPAFELRLERRKRRWKWVSGLALGLGLLLIVGLGLLLDLAWPEPSYPRVQTRVESQAREAAPARPPNFDSCTFQRRVTCAGEQNKLK